MATRPTPPNNEQVSELSHRPRPSPGQSATQPAQMSASPSVAVMSLFDPDNRKQRGAVDSRTRNSGSSQSPPCAELLHAPLPSPRCGTHNTHTHTHAPAVCCSQNIISHPLCFARPLTSLLRHPSNNFPQPPRFDQSYSERSVLI